MASEQGENSTGLAPGESPLVAVAEFPLLWRDVEDTSDFVVGAKKGLEQDDIQKELGVSAEIAAELANVCSPDTLQSTITGRKMDNHYNIMEGRVPAGGEQLHTVRSRVAENQRLIQRKKSRPSRNKLYHYDFDDTQPSDDLTTPVTLLVVTVGISNKATKAGRKGKQDRGLVVHANQPLTALKEKLVCPVDLVYLCGECSEFPETADDKQAHVQYKSAYFFIENVFYNDMRDPQANDISKPVRNWLNMGKSPFIRGNVSCAKMEDTTFNDLSIRLGYPYLYVHQGDCEHTITFTDIRFMHEKDCLDLEQYPILICQSFIHRISCHSCKLMTAKWMTRDDALTPADPSFFCDECYYKFHYDGTGNKVGSFKAYRHVDPSIFR